jgi:hydrogenase-4 component B
MPLLGTVFELSLATYLVGAFASIAVWRRPALARCLCCWAGLTGAILGGLSAILAILKGTPVVWSVPSGIPLFTYSFSYDALSGFFNLALAVLAAAVSIYSFGYLKEFEGKRNIALFGFLFHLLLLSLTVIFTAANAQESRFVVHHPGAY